MKYKIAEEILNDRVFFTKRKYSSYFFLYEEKVKDIKFQAFRIEGFEEGDKSGVVIEVKNNFLDIAKMIFSNYDGNDIYKYLERYQEFFQKNRENINILKLRGDFAELLFLKEIGGTKLDDDQIYDIEYKGEYIEVKSYSSQNRRVTISNEQLSSDAIKAVVEIKLDADDGLDIIALSKTISFNESFKEYINEKYSPEIYKDYKFSINTPQIWNAPKQIELIEPIISCKFKVNIHKKDLKDF